MNEFSALISDLALILVTAALVTLLFKRLRQPLVLGYIVAGFFAGPHMSLLPTVTSVSSIHTWADIGVIFLMFSLGLDFSFKKVLKMGSSPIISAICIILFLSILGYSVGGLFGWKYLDRVFLGGMLAMSSTTIIYKAFTDLSLREQQFTKSVLSVLVIEDILGILLMAILGTLAAGKGLNGMTLIDCFMQLLFYLILLLVVGIFFIPSILRKSRKWMGDETLLVTSIGLCFAMVAFAGKLGYSAAFGAFLMGSILAETIEADAIDRLISPIKDLFGAIFFVSVGMLVDPAILSQYWVPILFITATILISQATFGTLSFFISGHPLKMALQCGFSMAQIGEFAFIIASLGVTLGVTSSFLYPVVVAVSVITTFLTPYMIRLAPKAYHSMSHYCFDKRKNAKNSHLPKPQKKGTLPLSWKNLLKALILQVVVYGIVCAALILTAWEFLLPLFSHIVSPWSSRLLCTIIIILCTAPFLRAILMRKNHSWEAKALWRQNKGNRYLIISLWIARYSLCVSIIYYILSLFLPHHTILYFILSNILMFTWIFSRQIKHLSIRIERNFSQNLRARTLGDEVKGRVIPLYATHLLSRDIHMAELKVPALSSWTGKTLHELDLSHVYGVMVTSILRGGLRINIPSGEDRLFPQDKIQVIGNDAQLLSFARKMESDLFCCDTSPEEHTMALKCMRIDKKSPLLGKKINECRLREQYHCMIVGFEEGREELGLPSPARIFKEKDIVWVVGETSAIKTLIKD